MASKSYDVTLKDLFEDYTAAWPTLLSAGPIRGVDVIDADISTVTGASDKVARVHGQEYDWILNLEVHIGPQIGRSGPAALQQHGPLSPPRSSST
jgi:hypothetical protein